MTDRPAGETVGERPAISLGEAVVPLIALFAAMIGGSLWLGFGGDVLLLALIAAAIVAGLSAKRQGAGWDDIQRIAGQRIAEAFPALLILLAIGALLGSWMFSGTIPLMVVLGIGLIDPQFMALTAFVATALMSLISGTSWGSAGTMGVALMGGAEAMGLPLAPVAGAVVSGAYLGDKLSPVSDMTNIAAIGAGAELYAHIRHMLATSVPPAIVAAIVFAVAGAAGAPDSAASLAASADVARELGAIFRLEWWAALPLVVALVGIALRMPAALVVLASALLALAVGIAGQGFAPAAAATTFASGFDLAAVGREGVSDAVANLLQRGGVLPMAGTLVFVVAAFMLAAGMEASGALPRLLDALLARVRSAFGLVAASMAAGFTMVGVTSHGGVTALLVGRMFGPSYRARNLAPENLSRAIEDSVTVTEPLMPWTVSGIFMASTLGVSTLALAPWAVFCWLGPVCSLAAAALYEATGRGLKETLRSTDADE